MIIIFAAVVLVLGTGKLPGVAKKMGKVMSEYNNAKNEIQQQMKEVTEEIPKISGPVETEREKLEMISKSAGIKTEGKTDEELQKEISLKIGQKTTDTTQKTTDTAQKTTDTSKTKHNKLHYVFFNSIQIFIQSLFSKFIIIRNNFKSNKTTIQRFTYNCSLS